MKVRNVKGTRDIVGEDAILRSKIIDTLKKSFEKYGFQPFYTPVMESFDVLKVKVTDEMLGLMYEFKDKAKRDIGLRYDLTIGLARFAASSQIPLPFKRYQIERAWRYESPQAGRYREFWQADIDILGVENVRADAECLACISEALESVGIKKFTIRINSRKLLDQIAEESKITEKERGKVYQILDKLDKIGKKEVEKLLRELIGARAGKFLKIVLGKGKVSDDIKELKKYAGMYKTDMGKSKVIKNLKVDLSLVRGLAYYTGLIFEINAGTGQSIAGGGRYDDLIEKLGGRKVPATGISIGLDRIAELIKETSLKEKEQVKKTITQFYVIPVSKENEGFAIKVLQSLRDTDSNVDIALTDRSLSKSIDYANKNGIPFVIFVGKEEQKKNEVKLKDMKTGKESVVKLHDLARRVTYGNRLFDKL